MRKIVYGKTCSLSMISDAALRQTDQQALNYFLTLPSETDIHIYWHAIAYFLSGSSDGGDEPLCYLLRGGETIGQNEAGPVRYLAPYQVADFDAALARVSPDDIGEDLYDLALLDENRIYPERWQQDGEENDLLSNLRELYSYLQSFMARAAKQHQGVIIFYKFTELYFEDE